MTPIILVLLMPMFGIAVAADDPQSPILATMSWIPPFTPFLMIARLAGELSLAQAGPEMAKRFFRPPWARKKA